MTGAAVRNLHVPLPEELYRRLREEAQKSDRPATEICREAIERWLSERRKADLHAAIAAYAAEHAGSASDLDPGLEAACMEQVTAVDEDPA